MFPVPPPGGARGRVPPQPPGGGPARARRARAGPAGLLSRGPGGCGGPAEFAAQALGSCRGAEGIPAAVRHLGTRNAISSEHRRLQQLRAGPRRHRGTRRYRPFASQFRVVGSTASVDARDNTSTTYTSSDKGVPIYWVSGNKVADNYEDFYDGELGRRAERSERARERA